MTFAETHPGQTVRYCGQDVVVVEHVRGIGPGKHLTVCRRWNPRLKRDDEMTFNYDLPCERLEITTPTR